MEKADIETLLLATPMQESMLFSTLADPDAGHYILQLTFELHGEHQLSLLQQAWLTLLQWHTALRTQFVWKRQEKLRQLVRKRVVNDLERVDLTALPSEQQSKACKEFLLRDKKRGFILSTAPLTRLSVLELSANKKYCVWTFHHAIVDGWSIAILFKELCAIYAALSNRLPLPSAAIVDTLDELVDGIRQRSKTSRAFWQQQLADTQQYFPLAAIVAPQHGKHSHCTYEQTLDPGASEEIYAGCRAKRITFASLALASWSLLLAYYSGRDEVLFGSISSGRSLLSERGSNSVGLLISLLPMRVTLNMHAPLDDYLSEFQHQHMLRSEHEHVAPADVASLLNAEPGSALFDSMLVVENHPGSEQLAPATRALGVRNVVGYEQSDTPLAVSVGADGAIAAVCRFHGDRFSRADITGLLDLYFSLLSGMATATGATPLTALLPSLDAATDELAADEEDAAYEQRFVEYFNERVAQQPHDTALFYHDETISYAALADHAEAIRMALLQSGVGSGDTVAVYMERSPECIAALLAVLALDACYLALDPAYPAQRLNFMLQDSGSRLLLCADRVDAGKFNAEILQAPAAGNSLEHAGLTLSDSFHSPHLCLIYTSGSTGQPKGVRLRHDSMLNRAEWMWREYPFDATTVCCHRTPLGFVDSVCEIFSPLCQGIPSVVVGSEQVRDLQGFIAILSQHRVSRITLVPTLLAAILEVLEDSGANLPALQLCCCSGEPLPRILAEKFQRLLPGSQLLNLYGSTEVAADALCYHVQAPLPSNAIVPIGTPITATRALVLNAHGQPLPAGVQGELCIGGIAVADGYHQRSEETAANFINQPGLPRFYRSGDLSVQDDSGIFHYRGRLDRQLKIRGQRVEPGDVESILMENSTISHAVVMQSPDGRLIAAFTSGDKAKLDIAKLREKLELALPSFSLPQQLIQLDSIPLNSSAKVDYAALQAICSARKQTSNAIAPSQRQATTSLPRQAIFSIIQTIWQELLPDAAIEAGDNFFQLGGESLMAMRMIARVERRLGVALPLATFMNSPVLADFAAAVYEGKNWASDQQLLTLKAAKGRPGLFCIHGDAFNLAPHFSSQQGVFWLSQWPERMPLTQGKPSRPRCARIEDIASNYLRQVRAAQPQGPYYLIAGSAAGIIAYEMAQQLTLAGEQPAALLLMDPPGGKLQTSGSQDSPLHVGPIQMLRNAYRRFGPSVAKRQLNFFRAHYKLTRGHALTDLEARDFTNGLLFKAVSKYAIRPYAGKVVYIVSQAWARNGAATENLRPPQHWQNLMPNITAVHIAPAAIHNDLLRGESAQFIADLCAEIMH